MVENNTNHNRLTAVQTLSSLENSNNSAVMLLVSDQQQEQMNEGVHAPLNFECRHHMSLIHSLKCVAGFHISLIHCTLTT